MSYVSVPYIRGQFQTGVIINATEKTLGVSVPYIRGQFQTPSQDAVKNTNWMSFRPLYTGLVSNKQWFQKVYIQTLCFRPLYTGLVSNYLKVTCLNLKKVKSFRPLYTGLVSNPSLIKQCIDLLRVSVPYIRGQFQTERIMQSAKKDDKVSVPYIRGQFQTI